MWWQNIMHQRLTIGANDIHFSFTFFFLRQRHCVAQFSHNIERKRESHSKEASINRKYIIKRENPLNLFSFSFDPIRFLFWKCCVDVIIANVATAVARCYHRTEKSKFNCKMNLVQSVHTNKHAHARGVRLKISQICI